MLPNTLAKQYQLGRIATFPSSQTETSLKIECEPSVAHYKQDHTFGSFRVCNLISFKYSLTVILLK